MGHGTIMVISTEKDFRIDDASGVFDYLLHHDLMDYIQLIEDEYDRKEAMQGAEKELLQWFDRDGDAFILNRDKMDEWCDDLMEKMIDGGNKSYEGLEGLLELRYKLGDWYNSSPIIVHERGFTEGSTRTLTAIADFVDPDRRYYLVDVLDYHE